MWNASIFQPILLPKKEVMKEYVRTSVLVDNAYQNTKYVLTRMVGEEGDEEEMNVVRKCLSMSAICKYVGEEEFYEEIVRSRKPENQNNLNVRKREEEGEGEGGLPQKRAKVEE